MSVVTSEVCSEPWAKSCWTAPSCTPEPTWCGTPAPLTPKPPAEEKSSEKLTRLALKPTVSTLARLLPITLRATEWALRPVRPV